MMPKIGYPIADNLRKRVNTVYGVNIPIDRILQMQDVYRVLVANGSIDSIGEDTKKTARAAIATALEINPSADSTQKNAVNMIFREAVNEIAAGNIAPVYFFAETWENTTEREKEKHIAESERNEELTKRILEKTVPAVISDNLKKTVIILGVGAVVVGGLYAASLYTANRAIR